MIELLLYGLIMVAVITAVIYFNPTHNARIDSLRAWIVTGIHAVQALVSAATTAYGAAQATIAGIQSAVNGAAAAANAITHPLDALGKPANVVKCDPKYMDKAGSCSTHPGYGMTYRGVSTLSACPAGSTDVGLDCWVNTKPNGAGDVISRKSCPAGSNDIGTDCRKDIYLNGAGSLLQLTSCPSGSTDIGTDCRVEDYANGVGTIPSYKSCNAGYTDTGLLCTRGCGTTHLTSWGSAFCTGGRPFRFGGYDDCYDNAFIDCFNHPADTYAKPSECDPGYSKVGGLCYKDCKPGYEHLSGIGITCTPSGGRVKMKLADRIHCPEGKTQQGALCYDDCHAGYHMVSGIGTSCAPDSGIGVTMSLADRMYCPAGKTRSGALCYNDCEPGYHFKGGPLCEPDGGPRITKKMYDRQTCPAGQHLDSTHGFCHDDCSPGFRSDGALTCIDANNSFNSIVPEIKQGALDRLSCDPGYHLTASMCYKD